MRAGLRRFRTAATTMVAAALCASGARADIKLWEEHKDDPDLHRDFVFTGYVQPGYIWRQNDNSGPGHASLNPNQDDNFWVQRARFGFRSQIQRYLWLRIEYEAAASTMADAYVDARFHPALNVKFGQYQTPFLRTYLYSDSKLAFIDRDLYTPQTLDRAAITFLRSRDIGFQIYGSVPFMRGDTAPTLSYWVGMYLGQGPNSSNNFDNAYMYTGRVQLDALGKPDGEDAQSDLARNRTPRVSVGGGVYSNCDDRTIWNRGWTADTEFRYQGVFASASIIWFKGSHSTGIGNFLGYDQVCTDTSNVGPQIASGGSAQVGYVLPSLLTGQKQSVEVMVRYDQVNPRSPCNAFTGKCTLFGGDVNTPGYVAPPGYGDTDNPPSNYRVTAGLNFYPNNQQQLRLSLNYQIRRETENVITSGIHYAGIKNDAFWFQMTAGL